MNATRKKREIGPHTQGLRKSNGWTLDDLARASGVSRSMLSQIERGQANPTLATVWALADAFKLHISELIVHAEHSRTVTMLPAAKTPEMRSEDGKCAIRLLSPGESVGKLEWYELRFEPGGVLASEAHAKGSGEHLTVIDGALTVQIDGRRETVVKGATARYPVDTVHRIENQSKKPARAFLVVTY